MTKKCWFVAALVLFVSLGFMVNGANEVPKKALKLIKEGNEAMKANNYDKAKEAYDKAVELAPDYAPAYSARGHMLAAQKNSADAVKDFEKALESKDFTTFGGLGRVIQELRNG